MTPRRPGLPAQAFTTLWTSDQCRRLDRVALVGKPLTMTFGGPHQSAPSFRRAGIQPGDVVYPIRVLAGEMYVVGRIRIEQIYSDVEFIAASPDRFEGTARDRSTYGRLAEWIATDPVVAALCPGEADEVIIASDPSPITFDAIVPMSSVRDLRWQSGRRPERPIKHLDPDGRILRTISLQGVYRLTAPSAAVIDAAYEAALRR